MYIMCHMWHTSHNKTSFYKFLVEISLELYFVHDGQKQVLSLFQPYCSNINVTNWTSFWGQQC